VFRLPARNRFGEGRDFDIRICYFLSVVALVFIAGGIYDDPYIDQTAGREARSGIISRKKKFQKSQF
jgi:hypothetical protein